MTPKEKAEELRNKFLRTCSCSIAGTHTIFKNISKDLARICVNEILDGYRKILPSSRKYWQEVLSEIDNLK